jgi:hypothetical protein
MGLMGRERKQYNASMKQRNEGGFTLVELIFGAVIMALMVSAIASLYVSNLQTVVLGKGRAIGVALANEKMEALRDLPYDSVATQNGTIYPPGNIFDNETTTRDNFKFTIHTDISYIDDPYDGYASCPCSTGPAAGKPKDLYPYDYKKAQITVKLVSSGAVVATATTDIAGKAAETSSNTGILSITVIGADSSPIANAIVTITNSNPSPAVNITTTTDNQGLVLIPKLPPYSNNSYHITASLPGYSTDGTIPDPPGSQSAVQQDMNVLVQQVNPITLKIDRLSTLYVHAVDTSGNPMGGLSVTTTGTKQIKTNPIVYKYSQATATDASGNITLSGMEWDSYNFAMPNGYYLVSSSPYVPVPLGANSSATVNLVVSTSAAWPIITAATPISQQTGTNSFTIKLTGSNMPSTATMKLRQSGQSDISGTSCASSGSNPTQTHTCTFNLSGAATGTWDIAVTNATGTTTQTGGFSVTP